MQISLKWIEELVNIKSVNLDNLIEKLTLGGFEVEETIEIEINNQKQLALDVSATANRSDSLSIHGIGLEISALLNKELYYSPYILHNLNWKQEIKDFFEPIEVTENYSTFLAITIENISNYNSPKWMKEKLIGCGIIPLNTFTDFKNYILLETGYPFAVYDFDKISSKLQTSNFRLSLSNSNNNEIFEAANEINYKLDDNITVVKANDLSIGIGGIIENRAFSISNTTTSILLEGSIFSAAKIRQQARFLGLRTDRSARYEKSIKNTYLIESLYRLVSLLKIANPNLRCILHTYLQTSNKSAQSIVLKYKTIIEILGPINDLNENIYISPNKITEYLTRLNFEFSFDNSNLSWTVIVPYSRTEDLTREIDLIEEIGRLHGFNDFLTNLPKLKIIGSEDKSYQTRKKLTTCLINLGLNEFIHYSLVNQQSFINNEVNLVNPLLSDCSNLRISLLPNLIRTVEENIKQGNSFIEGFEYGHIFSLSNEKVFKETEYIAGIFGGHKTKLEWSEIARPMTWFEAKGKMEQLFNQLNLSVIWAPNEVSSLSKILHPYRKANLLLIDDSKLGNFGQINPILARKLNISTDIYLFEINFQLIKLCTQNNKLTIYKEYSLFPKIIKDLSFIISQNVSFEVLQKSLYANGTQFLSQIKLLDEYRGKGIPENETSLCLQLIFQSKEKTLQTKDIEPIITKLQNLLKQKFNAKIRE